MEPPIAIIFPLPLKNMLSWKIMIFLSLTAVPMTVHFSLMLAQKPGFTMNSVPFLRI